MDKFYTTKFMKKNNELEIPHFVLCQWTFSNMHICCRTFWMPSCDGREHIGIRETLSLHSEHIYKDKFWDEMSIKVNYCSIFQYTRNTGHDIVGNT